MNVAVRVSIMAFAGYLLLLRSDNGSAQGDYRLSCRPPLKFMAGACVTACYAGYEDHGRWCDLRRGGGGGGP
jgi:hypothetical protein